MIYPTKIGKAGFVREGYNLITNRGLLKRINLLIKECMREPYCGIGKPEALKFDLSGTWSRIINQEHRLVYKVEDDNLIILQWGVLPKR